MPLHVLGKLNLGDLSIEEKGNTLPGHVENFVLY